MVEDPDERWLEDWHDRHAGATARAFARGKPSSYEWLASAAQPGDRVLDLACGDGFLIEMLRTRGVAEVAGADMSAGELAAARARLGPAASLFQTRAEALPFPDAAFDLVTCHLALMLMSRVTEVIAEARRVLRPGGRLAAVVGSARLSLPGNAWPRLSKHLAAIQTRPLVLGDARSRTPEGLRELLGSFSEVRIEPFTVDLSGTPDELWALFVDMYNHETLEPEARRRLEDAVRKDWSEIPSTGGALPCMFGLTTLFAVRP